MTLEVVSKIINITFALTIMISALGWLGFKKGKKAYLILWFGVIPLIVFNVFLFFDKHEYYNIITLVIITIFSLSYITFLICCYPKFLKKKTENINQQQDINNIINLI